MITVSNLSHAYKPENRKPVQALAGVDLEIQKGEFICLIGPNASGKSSLVRHLNGLLTADAGKISVDGLNPALPQEVLKVRRKVGMVFQNPDSQLIGASLEEEIAFGPENLGLPPQEIRARVEQALDMVGLSDIAGRIPQHLSGGQKQRLAIAGVLAMEPEYLILDESTSMLDYQGRDEVLALIKQLNREKGLTVIFITHDLEEAAQFKRVLVMNRGRLVIDGPAPAILTQVERLEELNLNSPRLVGLMYALRKAGLPVNEELLGVEETALRLAPLLGKGEVCLPPSPGFDYDSPLLETKGLCYYYRQAGTIESVGIEDIDLSIAPGEKLGIIGPTGSGKSTLVQHFNRLLKPSRGTIKAFGEILGGKNFSGKSLRQKVGLIFQFPENQLFEETVRQDIAFGPKNMGLSPQAVEERVKAAMMMTGLSYDEYKDRSPFQLSGGEMRWVAIAGVLALGPRLLVLDEPLAGLDPSGKVRLREMLLRLNREQGVTLAVVSHSLEELGELADTLLVMKNQRILRHEPFFRLLEDREVLAELGMRLPIYTRLMLKLKEMGFGVFPAVFSLEQAKAQILALAGN